MCQFKAIQIIVFFIIGGMVLVGCRSTNRKNAVDKPLDPAPVPVRAAIAKLEAITQTVTGQGVLMPAPNGDAKLGAMVAGRLAQVLVKDGDPVHVGEVVAVLDTSAINAQIAGARAAVRAASAEAGQAQVAVRAAKVSQNTGVAQAELALQAAKAHLSKVLAGARPQQISAAASSIDQALATLSSTTADYTRVQFLFKHGIAPARELDSAKAAMEVAKANLAGAQAQLSLLKAGARPQDIQAAQIQVQQDQEALDTAKANAIAVELEQRKAQAMVEKTAQKQADLAALQTTASMYAIRSPLNGVVVHRNANPGDIVDVTSIILDVANLNHLVLTASLPASDLSLLKVGERCDLETPDFPGKRFPGTLQTIGQIDPTSNMLNVRVLVPNPQHRLRIGSFAIVKIAVGAHPHAVVVPKQAVVSRQAGNVIFVVDKSDVAHLRIVHLGVEEGDRVEVLSGISAGNRVITLGQYELANQSKVRILN